MTYLRALPPPPQPVPLKVATANQHSCRSGYWLPMLITSLQPPGGFQVSLGGGLAPYGSTESLAQRNKGHTQGHSVGKQQSCNPNPNLPHSQTPASSSKIKERPILYFHNLYQMSIKHSILNLSA